MVTEKIFEAALGISAPWYIAGLGFEPGSKLLKVVIDFHPGSRFAVAGESGEHPVHDTVTKSYRHLNFFQHECLLEVRVPRVKLPDESVRLVSPPWSGKLSGFTLLFEAFVLALCREMTFRGVSRITGVSVHRVMAICEKYVDEAVGFGDYSEVSRLAIDETSKAKGHEYVTLFADAEERRVLFVADGNDTAAVESFSRYFRWHRGKPSQVELISMDMWPAFIKGAEQYFPAAQIVYDKFHVIAHASEAIDKMRRIEQKQDASLKGLRWVLLKDRAKLKRAQRAELDYLLAHMTTKRTARAWLYREQLREIFTRKQPNVVRGLLKQWCSNVLRSKVQPMHDVANMIRNHFEGVLAWVTSRQTNGFMEAINSLFQAAKRKARGYGRFRTIRMVIFMIAGKLDFSRLNPHVLQPT